MDETKPLQCLSDFFRRLLECLRRILPLHDFVCEFGVRKVEEFLDKVAVDKPSLGRLPERVSADRCSKTVIMPPSETGIVTSFSGWQYLTLNALNHQDQGGQSSDSARGQSKGSPVLAPRTK